MGEVNLPEGWAQTVISDIADVNPKKIEAEAEALSGFVPMSHAPTDFNGTLSFEEKPWGEIKKSYTNFQDHDVIVAKVTPCFENGKAAIVRGLPNGIGAGSSEFYVLRPAIKEVSTRFLFSIVKSYKFLQEGAANMTGAVGLRRVPRAFVETFPIALPPLAEQKVIANKLDTLLAQVETTKARLDRIQQILKTFRQSVLAAAVSGKLTEEWRGGETLDAKADLEKELLFKDDKKRKIEATSSHELVVDNFSHAWAETKFDELYRFIDYRGKTPNKSESGKRLYTAKNIKMGYLSNEPIEYLSEKDYKSWMTRGFSKVNDIFFVTEGHTMGCVALNDIGSDIALAQRTLTLQPYGDVCTKFHYYFMLSHSFQKLVDLNATGTAAKGIKASKFRGLPLPFPTYKEQTEIVRRVEELFAFADRIGQKANAGLERVNNLTQSILAKAFRGELTSDWRANNPELISGDNSAEALLKKIKAERAIKGSGNKLKVKRTKR
ncbi:restriction endonuclease subunit S [Pseudoalteromonas sp. S554]|uniref:restriction endonuclease subunit S n=1 Tax=Pseudoalteromonas sp. S554 TaxID=2066516 RepID=UPI00110D12D5|nr:restriction endonuclease subunit S [Pseudoalteromonas sp. S554]TMS82691.1 type I restriction endonuclease subunit S [Pseudoalteromonas sp. S554]